MSRSFEIANVKCIKKTYESGCLKNILMSFSAEKPNIWLLYIRNQRLKLRKYS